MLRLAGSLKMGWVTASLIVQKLQAYPRQHPLTRALVEYGRLIKTIHILRWYADVGNDAESIDNSIKEKPCIAYALICAMPLKLIMND